MKFVATTSHFHTKMHQIQFQLELCHMPHWSSLHLAVGMKH